MDVHPLHMRKVISEAVSSHVFVAFHVIIYNHTHKCDEMILKCGTCIIGFDLSPAGIRWIWMSSS